MTRYNMIIMVICKFCIPNYQQNNRNIIKTIQIKNTKKGSKMSFFLKKQKINP